MPLQAGCIATSAICRGTGTNYDCQGRHAVINRPCCSFAFKDVYFAFLLLVVDLMSMTCVCELAFLWRAPNSIAIYVASSIFEQESVQFINLPML